MKAPPTTFARVDAGGAGSAVSHQQNIGHQPRPWPQHCCSSWPVRNTQKHLCSYAFAMRKTVYSHQRLVPTLGYLQACREPTHSTPHTVLVVHKMTACHILVTDSQSHGQCTATVCTHHATLALQLLGCDNTCCRGAQARHTAHQRH